VANGYVVVWQTPSGVRSIRVDQDGAPLSPPRALSVVGPTPLALLSNGSTALLITYGGATLLDSEGAVLRKVENLSMNVFLGGGVRNNRYVLLVSKTLNGPNALETIGDDASVAEVIVPSAGLPAFGRDTILLADSGSYTVMGYDGTIIKQATSPPIKSTRRDLAVGWDGHEFLAVFSGQDAFRVAPNGDLIDAAPFPISQVPISGLAFAAADANLLAVWSDQAPFTGGLVGRSVANFDDLAAPAPSTHLAYKGEEQVDVKIARNNGGVFGVWSDPGRYEVSAAFNGKLFTIDQTAAVTDWIGWPAIAAGDHVFLVVWRHDVQERDDRILARRFDFNGQPLDAAPLILDVSTYSYDKYAHSAPAIAFDGSTFFVAWSRDSSGGKINTIRVRQEGSPFDPRATEVVSQGFSGPGFPRSMRAIWTGAEFLAAYSVDRYGSQPYNDPGAALEMARFSQASSTAIPAQVSTAFSIGANGTRAAATVGDDRVTYAWVNTYLNLGVTVAQTTLDGKASAQPRVVVPRTQSGGASIADIAWNGSEYVLIWLDAINPDSTARKLRGIRLGADLKPIDGVPFDVFSGSGPLSPPWLIRTPTGVLIAYSRSDAANAGSARAFTRTLDRISTPPHRRAVGR
jgi:hypothetical protein